MWQRPQHSPQPDVAHVITIAKTIET